MLNAFEFERFLPFRGSGEHGAAGCFMKPPYASVDGGAVHAGAAIAAR